MLIFTCVGTGETNLMHDLKSGIKVKQRDSALTDLRVTLRGRWRIFWLVYRCKGPDMNTQMSRTPLCGGQEPTSLNSISK